MTETSFQPFLGKEWLVKTNSSSSTPYLFKFVSSTIDLTCSVLFTDTKSVWREELTSQQIARRWRQCNTRAPLSFTTLEDEDEWRTSILELLAKTHTIGGVDTLTFEVVHTHYSDIAFSLESTSFCWKWETCFVGHNLSADVISKHLVLPLITTNHLLFTSAEPVQDMADVDVEKAVDKIGRTARRSVDTHIKNVLSKPRVSTILRRITAMFNSLHELPSIISSPEEPNLDVPNMTSPKLVENDFMSAKYKHGIPDVKMSEPPKAQRFPSPMRVSPEPNLSPAKADSATEESEDEGETAGSFAPSMIPSQSQASRKVSPRSSVSPKYPPTKLNAFTRVRSKSPLAEASHPASANAKAPKTDANDKTSDDDSSPVKPPPKKARAAISSPSESDSETERKARVAQLKGYVGGSGMGGGAAKRGVRQPIKRGGKRF